jgi:riboflavin synthase
MFTGIVEEIGRIKNIRRGVRSIALDIEASKVLEDVHVGDSICTNGVCLTVTEVSASSSADGLGRFKADVMPETMRMTSFSQLKAGSEVNLERALTVNSRLGGHIVSGHIDGIGHIVRKEQDDNAVWLWIECDRPLMKYIVTKGSITLQGVSLTVAKVEGTRFAVSLIPHTKEVTTLHSAKVGSSVNIETDIIAKYVEKLLAASDGKDDKTELYRQFMKKNGI